MATGMVLSVAQTLFAALQCKELRAIYSMFEYESRLHELERTVTTVKAVLLDADSKQQELTHQGQHWVESLKDAVYDVDDLLDEFRTIMAQQEQQVRNAKISKKVSRFFSCANKVSVPFKTSHEMKKLFKQLDSISRIRGNFGIGEAYEPSVKREETTSFVCEGSIIGRETDKEAIVSMLLHESGENISFVSIVGIGGLGKTTLAQLVFNDDRIKSEYDLRMWVCVSPDYSMEKILSDMLEKDGLKKEVLQREVHQKIKGNKYLLVLDDVWNESRDEWVNLRNFLKAGRKGSRVLVTSRSKKVANIIENNMMYELQGLSEESSWSLFKTMAFEHGNEPADSGIVALGKEIVKRCANVPLCIRVMGGLLYSQVQSKRLTIDLSNLGYKEDVMPILKFSYYNLSSSLRSCFSYCALFPKGHVIKKQFLINLWAAHGCLDGLQEGQKIEDVGEEYFSTLLQRCFLQDIEKDEYDEISSCKMHDLIHDLAQEVAGKEINTKTRHIPIGNKSVDLFAQSDFVNKMENLRTFLSTYAGRLRDPDVAKIFAKCRRLRVLNLNFLGVKVFPNTFSHLIHLRYLELSYNDELEILPKSTTKLLNLQVFNLRHCSKLRELPEDLGKLVNLRQLDITGCVSVTHMPVGFDRLTCLHTLTMFVLGKGRSNQVKVGQLENLKHLLKLRGELEIVVKEGYVYDDSKVERKYLVNKSHVKALTIKGENKYCRPEVIIDERLLEGLEPHCEVRGLDIRGYEGQFLPYWANRMESSLPWLVNLILENFPRLHFLPSLSELQHLKFLKLWNMASLRYMKIDSETAKFTYFRSLETLVMYHLPNFDGWRTYTTRGYVPPFPCLQILQIVDCPSLKSFPQCPHLKTAKLMEFNQQLEFSEQTVAEPVIILCCGFSNSDVDINIDTPSCKVAVDMEELTIDNVEMLKSLSVQVKRFLHIRRSKIGSLSDAGIEHVTTDLRHFQISHCQNLVLEDEADGMMPWKALHTLTRLNLEDLPGMVNLPKGFQYLTSLHTLIIEACNNLEGLPEWLDSLTSLQLIVIKSCPKIKSLPEAISRLLSITQLEILECGDDLRERCKEPDGEDWPKICHIPSLLLSSDQV